MSQNLSKEYFEHRVFAQLDEYAKFYDALSFSIMGFTSLGTGAILNIDTYVYSSVKGTLESIKDVLLKGRINDAYALLRKYFDSTIINVYTNLYLKDNFSLDTFIVSKIDNWIKGTERLPAYRVMSKYIKDSSKLLHITELLLKDKRYTQIRDRCNDQTHYNFYRFLLENDNEIYFHNRIRALDTFASDLENIFIQHFAYIFYLNDHYMMASDYTDSLDLGLTPEEGSQNWVDGLVQKIFDKVIKPKRPDIAAEIKRTTSMLLE